MYILCIYVSIFYFPTLYSTVCKQKNICVFLYWWAVKFKVNKELIEQLIHIRTVHWVEEISGWLYIKSALFHKAAYGPNQSTEPVYLRAKTILSLFHSSLHLQPPENLAYIWNILKHTANVKLSPTREVGLWTATQIDFVIGQIMLAACHSLSGQGNKKNFLQRTWDGWAVITNTAHYFYTGV